MVLSIGVNKKGAGKVLMKKWDEKRVLWVLFLGSLVIRIIYVVFANANPIAHGQDIIKLHDDQASYWQFAEAFLRDISWMSEDVSYRPPGYPMFLALVAALIGLGKNFINVMLVQSVLSALTVVFIFKLAALTFNRATALLSALWAAVFMQYLYYCGFILRETLEILLFLLFVYCLIMYLQEARKVFVIIGAIIYALLIHIDPRYLFHLPFVFLYFYLGLRNSKKTLKVYLYFVFIVIICSLPWGIRNHIVYKGKFVLINTRTLDKWTAKVMNDSGLGVKSGKVVNVIEKPETLKAFEDLKRKAILEYQNKSSTVGGINNHPPIENRPYYIIIKSEEELKAFNRGIRPAYAIPGIYWNRFKEFWRFARFRPGYDEYSDLRFEGVWSFKHNLIGILTSGFLYPFFIIGVFFCLAFYFSHKNNYGLILFVIIFVHSLLHVLVHARERYRLPMEALIAMLAFYAITMWGSRYLARRRKA